MTSEATVAAISDAYRFMTASPEQRRKRVAALPNKVPGLVAVQKQLIASV
jgi:hypothetical protein